MLYKKKKDTKKERDREDVSRAKKGVKGIYRETRTKERHTKVQSTRMSIVHSMVLW